MQPYSEKQTMQDKVVAGRHQRSRQSVVELDQNSRHELAHQSFVGISKDPQFGQTSEPSGTQAPFPSLRRSKRKAEELKKVALIDPDTANTASGKKTAPIMPKAKRKKTKETPAAANSQSSFDSVLQIARSTGATDNSIDLTEVEVTFKVKAKSLAEAESIIKSVRELEHAAIIYRS